VPASKDASRSSLALRKDATGILVASLGRGRGEGAGMKLLDRAGSASGSSACAGLMSGCVCGDSMCGSPAFGLSAAASPADSGDCCSLASLFSADADDLVSFRLAIFPVPIRG
jgi:hypothetical protein